MCELIYALACSTVCFLNPHVSALLLLAEATRAIYDSGGTRSWRGMRTVGQKERKEVGVSPGSGD